MSDQPIFDKKNILVAGGAGFIGSRLCERLLQNARVICVDNFLTSTEANIDFLSGHSGDLQSRVADESKAV